MALLCTARKLSITRLVTSQGTLNYFHTLRKIDCKKPFTRKPWDPIAASRRNFFWVFKKRTQREIRLLDKPPDHYELIYRCPLDHIFLTFQHLGFYGAVIVCLVTLYKSQQFYELPDKRKEYLGEGPVEEGKELTVKDNEGLYLVAAFLFVISYLHLLTARMPMRIYSYPQRQKYLFCLYGMIPNYVKKLPVKIGELQPRPDMKVIIPWQCETYAHKETGQILCLIEDHFRHPGDMYVLLGLQKNSDVDYDHEDPEEVKHKKLKDTAKQPKSSDKQ